MIDEIKEMIIKDLNLEDVKLGDIDENAALFAADGVGLDSVDALELSLSIQRRYGIVLDSNTSNLKEIYRSVATLADFISKNRTK